jgi:hypothetical protein
LLAGGISGDRHGWGFGLSGVRTSEVVTRVLEACLRTGPEWIYSWA